MYYETGNLMQENILFCRIIIAKGGIKLSFKTIFNNFLQNLEALEIIIDVQNEMIDSHIRKEIQSGIDENTNEVTNILEQVLNLARSSDESEKNGNNVLEEVNEKYNKLGVLFSKVEDKENSKRTIGVEFDNSEIASSFEKVIKRGDLSVRQKEMLNRNSLTSLMIYFEDLVSGIIKERLKLHPNAFNPNDKSIKYSELIEFESFKDALDHLIEIEVMGIMHGGFKSWISYLNRAGVNTKNIDIFTEEINEAHNRRNLFVHNNGIINNVYLKKVDDKFTSDLIKGSTIHITEEYLKKSLRIVRIYGSVLILESWKLLKESEKDSRLCLVDKIGYEALVGENWVFAKYLYEFVFKETDQYGNKISSQINIWFCEKKLGKFEEIKSEIKSYDVSGLKSYYELCILAILEEHDRFFELLEREPKSIEKQYLREWPILELVRKDDRIEKFLSK